MNAQNSEDASEEGTQSTSSMNIFRQLLNELNQEREVKQLIEDMCPAELKKKVELRRLIYIRIWVIILASVFVIYQIRTLNAVDPMPFHIIAIHWLYTFVFIVLITRSYFNIHIIKLGIIVL